MFNYGFVVPNVKDIKTKTINIIQDKITRSYNTIQCSKIPFYYNIKESAATHRKEEAERINLMEKSKL